MKKAIFIIGIGVVMLAYSELIYELGKIDGKLKAYKKMLEWIDLSKGKKDLEIKEE